MSGRRALVAGTIALDIIPQFPPEACRKEQLIAEGKTIYIPDIALTLGGLVANTGIAMHRLGANVVLSSKVGDDPLGGVIRSLLEEEQVQIDLRAVSDKRSSATIVTVPMESDRTFWHRRGASQEYDLDDLSSEMLDAADLFHFGYPTGMRCMYIDGGERLERLYRGVKQRGLTTSMDLSLPGLTSESAQADWKEILARVLPYVDVFLPSLEETLFLLHKEDYLNVLEQAGNNYAVDYIDLHQLHALGDEILGLGAKVFGLKLGKKGIYLRTADKQAFRDFGALGRDLGSEWWNRELLVPPFALTQLCSTNGAGDTAIAGFLTGLMDAESPENCLKLAAGAAAVRIESPDGQKGLCGAASIWKRIEEGWDCVPLDDLDPAQWHNDPQKKLYVSAADGN